MHIKKGDTVMVLTGKEKKKRGKVIRIFTKTNRAIVEKLNMVKRHQRATPTRATPQRLGGIIEKEAPIHISNLQLICSKCNKPTRVGYRIEAGKKVRYCKKCTQTIDR